MALQIFPVTAFASGINTDDAKQTQCVVPHTVVSESYDEQGNLIQTFDDGIEVIFVDDNHFTIRDYQNIFNMSNPTGPQTRSVSTVFAIGKAILTAAGVCSGIEYLSGVDVCRIALSYLGKAIKPGTYTVNGRFVKAPENCEPRHSSACQGHWEYSVVKE